MDGCLQVWYSILNLQTVKLKYEIREASIVADLGCIGRIATLFWSN